MHPLCLHPNLSQPTDITASQSTAVHSREGAITLPTATLTLSHWLMYMFLYNYRTEACLKGNKLNIKQDGKGEQARIVDCNKRHGYAAHLFRAR